MSIPEVLATNADLLIAIFLGLAAIIGSYLSYLAWKQKTP